MISQGLYDKCDYRYDLNQLKTLGFPDSVVNLLKNQAQKIACLVHQKYLTRKEGGWGFTEDVPTLAEQQEKLLGSIFGEDEAFRKEFVPGFGTAFLVGTAGLNGCPLHLL